MRAIVRKLGNGPDYSTGHGNVIMEVRCLLYKNKAASHRVNYVVKFFRNN